MDKTARIDIRSEADGRGVTLRVEGGGVSMPIALTPPDALRLAEALISAVRASVCPSVQEPTLEEAAAPPRPERLMDMQMTSQADVARIKGLGGLSAKANFGAHVPMKDDILRLPTRSGEIFDCVVLERECAPTAKGAVWRLHVAGI